MWLVWKGKEKENASQKCWWRQISIPRVLTELLGFQRKTSLTPIDFAALANFSEPRECEMEAFKVLLDFTLSQFFSATCISKNVRPVVMIDRENRASM